MRGILAGFAALLAAGKHLWISVLNVAMYTTSSKKLKGVRPHMLYQNTFYKGLDYSF
jgi:peptide/nickel transport system substrate-binding protein